MELLGRFGQAKDPRKVTMVEVGCSEMMWLYPNTKSHLM
jgi:hypothetical protein